MNPRPPASFLAVTALLAGVALSAPVVGQNRFLLGEFSVKRYASIDIDAPRKGKPMTFLLIGRPGQVVQVRSASLDIDSQRLEGSVLPSSQKTPSRLRDATAIGNVHLILRESVVDAQTGKSYPRVHLLDAQKAVYTAGAAVGAGTLTLTGNVRHELRDDGLLVGPGIMTHTRFTLTFDQDGSRWHGEDGSLTATPRESAPKKPGGDKAP